MIPQITTGWSDNQALGGDRNVRRDRQAHGLDLLNQASQRMSVSDLADADQKRL
jgi:hypothetical protein